MRTRTLITVAAAALAALVLAACGGDSSAPATTAADTAATPSGYGGSSSGSGSAGAGESSGSGGSGGGTVKIAAEPNALAFQQTKIIAPAGQDTIEFDNPSATGHNVEIEDSSGEDIAETDTISDGKTSTTADLQPGTYTFYCGVPGHREAGMQGTITVK